MKKNLVIQDRVQCSLVKNYMDLTLEEFRKHIDELIDRYGKEAIYSMDAYVDGGYVSIDQCLKTQREETDEEYFLRVNKEAISTARQKKQKAYSNVVKIKNEIAQLQKLSKSHPLIDISGALIAAEKKLRIAEEKFEKAKLLYHQSKQPPI